LLPNPDGVRLYPRQILQILNRKCVHAYTTIPVQKSLVNYFFGTQFKYTALIINKT
jgi:hypothetical protein